MWHVTSTQGNGGDSWLLMVGNQIGHLSPNLSFGHNLYFKYPNGCCEPILDIYVSRFFQWYKFFFNPMSFGPCNCLLKIRKSIGTPTPKMGVHWKCEGSFPQTFLHSWEHEVWLLSSLLACTFASFCLGREPKARVTTQGFIMYTNEFILWWHETTYLWTRWFQYVQINSLGKVDEL
jgi:hypothetical protein